MRGLVQHGGADFRGEVVEIMCDALEVLLEQPDVGRARRVSVGVGKRRAVDQTR